MSELVSLAKTMLENHGQIDELFKKLKGDLDQDSKTSLKLFNDFMWHLEKHFSIEEKAIFVEYHSNGEEISTAISNLLEEHEVMLKLAKEVEEGIMKNKKVGDTEFDKLRTLLIKHKNYEDNFFYPMLDLELSNAQKKLICEKINECHKWQ